MKICIISDYLPVLNDNWSGAELVAWQTGKLLSDCGHTVSHIALSASPRDSANNIYSVRTPFERAPFLAKNIFIDLPSFIAVFAILLKLKPDVVHIQAKFLFLPAALSAFLLRIRYYFTVLDYYIVCPLNLLLLNKGELCEQYHGRGCSDCLAQSPHSLMNSLRKLKLDYFQRVFFAIRKRVVDYFMNRASKIITFSKTSKNRLLAYGYKENQIEIVYHYKFEVDDCKDESSDIKSGYKNILFVGSLTEHKGLHIIVEAMKYVVKEIQGVRLTVVGSGKKSYIDKINRLTENYALTEYINFIGHKDNKEVLRLIKASDLVVVPEQWYSEFGPVILIESKLQRKPVVAGRIGSIPEYIRDGIDGILVDYNSGEQFARAIIRLLKDNFLASRMGNEISENIPALTDEKRMVEKLEKLYRG